MYFKGEGNKSGAKKINFEELLSALDVRLEIKGHSSSDNFTLTFQAEVLISS